MSASRRTTVRLATLFCLLLVATPAWALRDPIRVEGGAIRGYATRSAGVRAYLGIPYAAPPVGRLRWRPPQSVKPWSGVRDCTRFGPGCPQPPSPLPHGSPGRQSEDCLTLNVWTAAARPGENRPVMVFIHGGGNVNGDSSGRLYDGRHFAAHGVVLVSINYRLGVLGFLAHPALDAESPFGVSGDYGILDQIAALKWVRRNIARFGGDPHNVTVFGESAGSVDIGVLLVSPLSRGLFQRAIMESGTPMGLHTTRAVAERIGERVFRAVGAKTLAQARAVPASRLVTAIKTKADFLAKGTGFGPIVDGRVLPDRPARLVAEGKFHRVPLMIGTNADEGTLFTKVLPRIGPLGYRFSIHRWFGAQAPAVLRLFPSGLTARTTRKSLDRLVTVAAFTAPTRRFVRQFCRHEPRSFLYRFTRICPMLARLGLGATHGSELPYVFDVFPRKMRAQAIDRHLSREMQAYWIRFATTGDPNERGLPHWPRYSLKGDQDLELGATIHPQRHLDQAACDLLDRAKIRRSTWGRGHR